MFIILLFKLINRFSIKNSFSKLRYLFFILILFLIHIKANYRYNNLKIAAIIVKKRQFYFVLIILLFHVNVYFKLKNCGNSLKIEAIIY